VKEFIVAGVAQRDGEWYALGTYDGRFLQLPISEDEAHDITPKLSDDRTYRWAVSETRMLDDGEMLIVQAPAEVATA
jgi:hypothetical protein